MDGRHVKPQNPSQLGRFAPPVGWPCGNHTSPRIGGRQHLRESHSFGGPKHQDVPKRSKRRGFSEIEGIGSCFPCRCTEKNSSFFHRPGWPTQNAGWQEGDTGFRAAHIGREQRFERDKHGRSGGFFASRKVRVGHRFKIDVNHRKPIHNHHSLITSYLRRV